MRNLLACSASLLFVVGCNTSGVGNNLVDNVDAGTDDMAKPTQPDMLDVGAPSETYPAFMPDVPQVVKYQGPVLARPKFIPVFFANADATEKSALEDFESKVGATQYWNATTSEYGVGAASSVAPVELTETPDANLADDDIAKWLADKLNANDPALPQPTGSEIYVLHYPAGVTITLPSQFGTTQSCREFGGYHSNTQLDSAHKSRSVAYAVIPNCLDDGVGGLSGIDSLTGTVSHELIEASTDPYPQTNPAYGSIDDAHLYWSFILGAGETTDMCAQDPSSYVKFPGLDYIVSRSWSNEAAAAGMDPCQPVPAGQTYFAAVPELTEDVTIGGFGQSFTMTGVNIPVGEKKIVPLDLFSEGPMGAFTVKVQDGSVLMGGRASLGLTLNKSSGVNGEKLLLTIDSQRQSQYGASVFIVTASKGGQSHTWFGLVGQQ